MISWPLVAAIGMSRVYIGAHYLTDVIGGWIVGVVRSVPVWPGSLRCWSRFRPVAETASPAGAQAGSLS
ncbi:MAG: phosphatase PAP2 family protein [Nitrospira sp.]|nr:phosphatase PAP2 family protein [Nitrospira sp.]